MEHVEQTALSRVVLVGAGSSSSGAVGGIVSRFFQDVVAFQDTSAAANVETSGRADLILITESVSPEDALAFLAAARLQWPTTPVVRVADKPSVELAVRFTRAGAYDYLAGPLDEQRMRRLVEGMIEEATRRSPGQERFFCDECPPTVPIVGTSGAMVEVLEAIRLVSESRCNPVLVLGATGTGKELAARAVHAWRCGDDSKYLAVNCAALTANLLESELFGHVRGAFTGADRDKTGLFEAAGDGTILLDEISEMPPALQAKLLRVLQERSFRKVGGTKDIPCRATIAASSNRDLLAESKTGRFRKDLYYRLAVFPITMPALAGEDRRGDIPLLAEYFIRTSAIPSAGGIAAVNKAAQEQLMQHDWPGNVRELRNVIERAIILEQTGEITPGSLVIDGANEQRPPAAAVAEAAGDFALETAEREFIIRALKETGWQRTRAAALLGITRATLHAKLKRYGITPPAGQSSPSARGAGGT